MSNERGMSVIEVVVTMSLLLVVMGLVLTTMESFGRSTGRATDRAQADDTANLLLNQMVREMRNATGGASSTTAATAPIIRATATDVVFRRFNPVGDAQATSQTSTVRYCLDGNTRTLHRQVQAGDDAPAAACPDPAWPTPAVAQGVANQSVALFTYNSTVISEINSIAIDLRIDEDPSQGPAAVRLQSGVALRNANRRPIAGFVAIPTPNRHVLLNATTSSDPDGQGLVYTWTDGSQVIPSSGPVLDYVAPAAGARTIKLVVTDPGGLTAENTQTVSVQP